MVDPKRGNDPTPAELVERYQRRVWAVIYRMTGSLDDVDDLTQETFLEIFRHVDRLREARDRDAWVYRVAMNVSIDHVRRKGRERASDAARAAPDAGTPRDGSPLEARASRALQDLPAELRQVIILRVFEGLTHEEISEILAAPVATVRWRLFEARRRLGERLRPFLGDAREDLR